MTLSAVDLGAGAQLGWDEEAAHGHPQATRDTEGIHR